MDGRIQLQFKLPAEIKKEGAWFISSCPLLDIFSQGKTKQEALTNLNEAVRLFIESCIQRGTLEQVLRESGFQTAVDTQGSKDDQQDEQEYVNVPLSLIAHAHAEAHAH